MCILIETKGNKRRLISWKQYLSNKGGKRLVNLSSAFRQSNRPLNTTNFTPKWESVLLLARDDDNDAYRAEWENFLINVCVTIAHFHCVMSVPGVGDDDDDDGKEMSFSSSVASPVSPHTRSP